MINTAHSEQVHRRCTVFLIWILVAMLPTSPVQAQTASPPVADPVAQAEIQTLWDGAKELQREGKFTEAIDALQKMLVMERKHSGGPHPELAVSLVLLAQLQESAEDYAAASVSWHEVQAIRTKFIGANDWLTRDALRARKNSELIAALNAEQRKQLSLADHHSRTSLSLFAAGRYREAMTIVEQALKIRIAILGEQNLTTATSLQNLGWLYARMGDSATAEPLYRQALKIQKTILGEEHPEYAIGLNNLGRLYASMGDFARAEPLHLQALDTWKKVLGEEYPEYASSLNNLALLYASMGDYAKAEPLCRQALDIQKKVLGEEHPDYASSLNTLAILYASMGDYAKAEPLWRQALDIQKKVRGEEHPRFAIILNNLAAIYASIGDYAKSEPLCRQALDITKRVLGEEHSDYAAGLDNLATIYASMCDYAKAEPLYRQALDIRKKVLGEEHPDFATSLDNLAFLYASIGDSARVEPLYRQALDIRKKVHGEEHPACATSLGNLAAVYASMADYERAEPLLRRALYSTRASLEATALIQSERQQLAMAQGLRYQLDNYVSLAISSQQFDEQAFREVLAWKGAVLVRQRQMRKVGENVDVAPLFKQLQETATRLATLSRLDTEPEKQVAWRRQITDLTAEKERLEAELSLKSSEFREAQKEVSLEDLLTSLPDNAALVDFLEYNRRVLPQEAKSRPQYIRSLVAFVVRRDKPITLLDLGPVAPLSEAIDVWRTTFGTSREGAAAGRLLRETIWVPVETHLDGADLILVSVDGALGRLPLAALPGKEPGTFLLEDHRLAMLPVPQLLPALISNLGRRELSGGLLLMGDVNYDADSDTAPAEPNRKSWKRSSTSLVRGDAQFSPLAATAGEIASIKELFTDLFHPESNALKTLKQAAATEQEFRESAPQFYNLHLATHGFFAAAEKKSALASDSNRNELQMLSSEREQMIRGFNPGLLSGLAFSGANRKPEVDKDDGILTADEIATLSLDGVDLVVLSACETGLGEVAGGEGLLGVQRAFQVAGARTTVASLWQVEDVATRRLMERFYRAYWQNDLSKLDALRDAQLYLLNHPEAVRGDRRLQPGDTSEPKRLSPQFWAAFLLSGDWR